MYILSRDDLAIHPIQWAEFVQWLLVKPTIELAPINCHMTTQHKNDQWVRAGHQDWCEVRLADNKFTFKLLRPAKQLFDNFQDACDFNAKLL